MSQSVANVLAAVIIGASIVVGTFLIRAGIDAATEEVAFLRDAIAEIPRSPQPSAAAAVPGRPDPGRRYSVNTEGSPVKGNPDAKLSIVEFSDFECPFCERAEPTLAKIMEEYGDRVRVVFKHLPLGMHRRAPAAHAAAEAAHRQGRFWEMHDLIFSDQRAMSPERYLEYANQIGLDVEQFERDLAAPEVAKRVERDSKEAVTLGVTGTPSFFVNGRFVRGAQPYEVFEALIEEELGRG